MKFSTTIKDDIRIGSVILEKGEKIRIFREGIGDKLLNYLKNNHGKSFFVRWRARNFMIDNKHNPGILGFKHPNNGFVQFDVQTKRFIGRITLLIKSVSRLVDVVFSKIMPDGETTKVVSIEKDLEVQDVLEAIDAVIT